MCEEQIRGLIVDDEPAARLEIRECAEVLGYDFIEAGSVEEARDVLRRERVDFVVLDLSIPPREGRPDKIQFGKVLLDEILREHPGVGIVVVTAHETYYHAVDIMRRSNAVSAVSFVPKPFDDNPDNPSLTEEIQQILLTCRSSRPESSPRRSRKPVLERRPTVPIAEIDIRILGGYRGAGFICLVNNERRRFSKEQYKVLKAFAVAQADKTRDPLRHQTVVNADHFHINNDHTNRHSLLSRLRTRLRGYVGEDYGSILASEEERHYSLGCYCIDSTPTVQAKAAAKAGSNPKPPPAEQMD